MFNFFFYRHMNKSKWLNFISMYIIIPFNFKQKKNGESFLYVLNCKEKKYPSWIKGYRVLITLFRFPKEDTNAPRMRIAKKECPDEYDSYMDCLTVNAANPDKCIPLRDQLFVCGRPGFRKANTDPDYEYWSPWKNNVNYH